MTITELAEVLGVKPRTITQWMVRSLPTPDANGKPRTYASMPFPKPVRYAGKSPEWERSSLPEIQAWVANRPGRGVGGGRPRKASAPSGD